MESLMIESPATHRYIYIGGETYNKLIASGKYTEAELLSLPRIVSVKKTKSPKTAQKQLSLRTSAKTETQDIPQNIPQNIPQYIPQEIISHIASYTDVPTARLAFNKQIYSANQQRYDQEIRDRIYQFIVRHYTPEMYQEHDMRPFDSYEDFLSVESQHTQALTVPDIHYINQLIKKIKQGDVLNMDKEGMRPCFVFGILFYKNKLITINGDNYIEDEDIVLSKPIKSADHHGLMVNSLYHFINDHFDDYDYDRFVDYNEQPYKSRRELMLYQRRQLDSLPYDDLRFLQETMNRIKTKKLLQTSSSIFLEWKTSGFLFLNDKLVLFHER